MGKITDKNKVYELLKVNDPNEINQEKVAAYMMLMNKIDKETNLEIVKSIPKFFDFASKSINGLKSFAEQNEKANSDYRKNVGKVIDYIGPLLKQEDLSDDMKKFIIEKLTYLAELNQQMDQTNKGFLKEYGKYIGTGLFAIILVFLHQKFGDNEVIKKRMI